MKGTGAGDPERDEATLGFDFLADHQVRERWMEVLTIGSDGEVLPVFSFEDEAEMFFKLGALGGAGRPGRPPSGSLSRCSTDPA